MSGLSLDDAGMISSGNKHRICMVTQSHYPTDPRVRREAETAVAAGWGVFVLSLRGEGEPRRRHLNGVTVLTLSLAKKRGRPVRYLFEYVCFFLWASWTLIFLQLRHGFGIIQVHTLPDFLVFSALVPRLLGARVILDLHEIMPEFFASKYQIPDDHPAMKGLLFIERLSARFADTIITVNDPIKDLLVRRGFPPAKITVVMNSADESLFDGARSSHPIPQRGGFALMYHGTLTSIYGLDIAVRSLNIIRRAIPDVHFHILGEGPEEENLRRLAEQLQLEEHITFHGRVPLERIPSYLSGGDIGVLPTRQDRFLDLSFSNKLLEYICMKKPVACSRLFTTGVYFRESSLAYFQPHDPADLASRIISLYRDRGARDAQVASALQDYEKIRWPIMKERYLQLLRNLVPSGRSADQQA